MVESLRREVRDLFFFFEQKTAYEMRISDLSSDVCSSDLPLPKECSACNFLKPPKTKECPICHHVAEAHSSLEEEDGELVQIDGKKLEVTKDEKQRWLSGLYWIAAQRGYKQGWAANQYRERFG